MRVFVAGLGAALACLLVAACSRQAASADVDMPPGGLRTELSAEAKAAFDRGAAAFAREYAPPSGLGPYFNAASCATCHNLPTTGGVGPDSIQVQVLFHKPTDFVGVLQSQHIAGRQPLPVPTGGIIDRRRGPPLYGLGLLEQVTDDEMRANCDPDDKDGDGVRGHVNVNPHYDGRPGKFGLQAHTSSIRDFIGNALAGEMGITNFVNRDPAKQRDDDAVPDPEAATSVVDDLTAYVAGLAAPNPARAEPEGLAVFSRIGCATCHKPDAGKRATGAYTDLCVHGMGSKFGSGIVDFSAKGDEWRTAPLWGLRFRSTYFHDGRAKDLPSAIAMHGGESAGSAQRYAALAPAEQQALLRFLAAL